MTLLEYMFHFDVRVDNAHLRALLGLAGMKIDPRALWHAAPRARYLAAARAFLSRAEVAITLEESGGAATRRLLSELLGWQVTALEHVSNMAASSGHGGAADAVEEGLTGAGARGGLVDGYSGSGGAKRATAGAAAGRQNQAGRRLSDAFGFVDDKPRMGSDAASAAGSSSSSASAEHQGDGEEEEEEEEAEGVFRMPGTGEEYDLAGVEPAGRCVAVAAKVFAAELSTAHGGEWMANGTRWDAELYAFAQSLQSLDAAFFAWVTPHVEEAAAARAAGGGAGGGGGGGAGGEGAGEGEGEGGGEGAGEGEGVEAAVGGVAPKAGCCGFACMADGTQRAGAAPRDGTALGLRTSSGGGGDGGGGGGGGGPWGDGRPVAERVADPDLLRYLCADRSLPRCEKPAGWEAVARVAAAWPVLCEDTKLPSCADGTDALVPARGADEAAPHG